MSYELDDIVSSFTVKTSLVQGGVSSSETSSTPYLSSHKERWWNISGHKPPYVYTLDYTVHRVSQTPSGMASYGSSNPESGDSWQVSFNPVIGDLRGLLGLVAQDPDYYLFWTQIQNELILKAGQSQFQAPVFILEFRKTVDFVYDLGHRAKAASHYLKRLRKQLLRSGVTKRTVFAIYGQSAEGIVDLLADGWMAWRYCLCTGLMDAEDMGRTAAQLMTSNSTRYERTVRSPNARSGTIPYIDPEVLNLPGWPVGQFETKGRWSCKFKAWAVTAPSTNSLNGSLRLIHSLGLNPISVAWEMTTLSWLSDWALNLDDYFRGQTALLGVTVVDSGMSSFQAAKGDIVFTPQWPVDGNRFGVSFTASVYNRYAISLDYNWVPTPVMDIINPQRLFDAVSLLKILSRSK